MAGLIDNFDSWIGGTTTLVQVGDILDRGDEEIQLLYMLERLQKEATKAGGAVHILNGNHETMNVAGQYRYATVGGVASFASWARVKAIEAALRLKCDCISNNNKEVEELIALAKANDGGKGARSKALSPGGAITTRFFAPNSTALQIGSTLFVHGGALPEHVEYGLSRINKETQTWMLGGDKGGGHKRGNNNDNDNNNNNNNNGGGMMNNKPAFLSGRKAIVWARDYSNEDVNQCDCDALQKALSALSSSSSSPPPPQGSNEAVEEGPEGRRVMVEAKRMVVGHTIQEEGINSACQGRVIRIDVGLSAGCGDGEPQVLEIIGDGVKVRRIREEGVVEPQHHHHHWDVHPEDSVEPA
jgi:hypothetical protein